MFRIHATNPAEAVEAAYFRVQRERMAGLPIHNAALSVAAVDFQKWQGHWLGMVVAPWCMSVLLVPGQEAGWAMPGDNQRRFIKFPAGDFAFLGSLEPEIGEFLTCALFSPMDRFASQAEAEEIARTSLALMLRPPGEGKGRGEGQPAKDSPEDEPSMSRRRFFGLRK